MAYCRDDTCTCSAISNCLRAFMRYIFKTVPLTGHDWIIIDSSNCTYYYYGRNSQIIAPHRIHHIDASERKRVMINLKSTQVKNQNIY